jgi:adenosylmethionine-8-amino-7-oxononanoate aminotransferase
MCLARFVEAGVFVWPLRNIIYLTPAFMTDEEDLKHLTRAVL